MEIYHSLEGISTHRPSAVALGFFDGLHLGHTTLLSRLKTFAAARNLSADVFTFREHPRNVMSGEMIIPRLLSETQKLELLAQLGIDRVYDVDFADGFHTMESDTFAYTLLKETFAAKAVFCGFNFHFGAGARGDTALLREFGKQRGFETYVIAPVYVSERLVSSTLIRRCVNDGEIDVAGRLLGRDFCLEGIVKPGRQIGRKFGFATANIFPDSDMALPPFGVYITETLADGIRYPSVTNIGIAPTIEGGFGAVRAEAHLLHVNQDLYGKKISIYFKKMLRQERRFENEEALKRQIASDVESTRIWFSGQ